jgi:Staphylococcal nuclease homologue/Excalibur calcium-binding domain
MSIFHKLMYRPGTGTAFWASLPPKLGHIDIRQAGDRARYQKRCVYGRYIATIFLNTLNINLTQIKRGLAWAYRQYVREQIYITTETYAKIHRLGLWIQPNPVAPWVYRHPVTNLLTKPTTPGAFSCANPKKYCKDMYSLAEAYFYLNKCGVKSLDGDKDGIPCEALQ